MLVSVELTVRIDEKVIKTNQIFTMTPKEYYEWSYGITEKLESRFLPIEIRNNNFPYSIEEEKIEPYNDESLEEIRNFMQDFWLNH